MIKATSHGKEHWYPILEEYSKETSVRKEIVMRLYEEHDLDAWWAQMTAVEWERDTNRREMNQSCYGSYQFSTQKTYPGDLDAAWQAVVSQAWLEGMRFEEGYEFDIGDAHLTVRAVRPGKIVRIWWQEERGKSVLEIQFYPKNEKCAIRFQHQKLPEESDIAPLKSRWQSAIASILEN
jgi:hypothetical protein